MKTNTAFRFLSISALVLLLTTACFAQAPKKTYSEVYYHKIKPGHTFAEARAIENEFKKLHQAQADDGFILGWYMLALDMTSNPNPEYSYVTIKSFSDLGYMDNGYPQKYFTQVMGTDYQTKLNDLYKRMQDVKEVIKAEIWEDMDWAAVSPLPSPDKAPVWMVTNAKVKNGQYEEYIAQLKKAKPYIQERLNMGDGVGWNLAALAFPWGSEKGYHVSSVISLPNRKAMLDDSHAEAAFKKAMPGVDRKQFNKELNALAEIVRQEEYYLLEYAVKASSVQAAKK